MFSTKIVLHKRINLKKHVASKKLPTPFLFKYNGLTKFDYLYIKN